jgi:hypothetical protein
MNQVFWDVMLYQPQILINALENKCNAFGFMVKHSNKNGLLELCTSQTAVTSISASYLFYSLLKPNGQISFFIPDSTNQQT